MAANEEWASIEGLSRYLVSSHGRVKSASSGRIYAHNITANGSRTITLQSDWGKWSTYQVKWLVYRAFNDGHVPARRIRHIDGDRSNVAVWNLIAV